ncbi:hypothetical protein NUU61_006975 [Penicillium alfredii]|uniref:polynucleotide adenylyltransferase n=1 Tax=Penicillium alfredii TaxID=1506179 RepID=A0A9W9F1X8_9EURO|nr:uncharacterized protein NUU61_006975 [Penicillium alfredii]KAJ5092105.1 hypothetical protein NUU61_006975 [Penicillium alfredii]
MPPFQFRGNRDRQSRPRQEFTFRYPRPPTAERPLLRGRREATPEQLVGETAGDKSAPKFASLDAMSDSEEAEMEVSSDDSDDESRPRKKRALAVDGPSEPAAAPPAPKWSNPDPYTSLPPPDESQSKRVDVVKLIRKARVSDGAAKAKQADAVKDNEDFISFGMDDEDESDHGSVSNAPESAPRGPRGLEPRDPAITSRKRTREDEIKGYSRKAGKPMGRFRPDGSILDQWLPLSRETATPWMKYTTYSTNLQARFDNEILSFYNWVKPQPFEQIVRADLIDRLQSAFQNRYSGVRVRPFGSFASGLYLPTADIDLVLLSTAFISKGVKTFGERKGQIYAFAAFLRNSNITVPNSIEVIAGARVPILKFVDKLTGLRVDLSFDNDSGLIANETFQKWQAEFPEMPVIVSVIKQFLLLRGLNEVPTGGLGGFSITCLVTSLLQQLPHGDMKQSLAIALMEFFNFYGNYFKYESVGIRMEPPGYFNKVFFGNRDRLTIRDPNNASNDISGGTKEIEMILTAFSRAYRNLNDRLDYLVDYNQPDLGFLGTIIGANYDDYTEQRYQLRHVFETSSRFARHRSPPPPPPMSPPGNEAAPPPLPPGPPPGPSSKNSRSSTKTSTNGAGRKMNGQQKQGNQQQGATQRGPAATATQVSDQSSGDEDSSGGSHGPKERKMTKNQTRRTDCQKRATRFKQLRPDLRVPDRLSLRQARRLAGYETNEEMEQDLQARENAPTGAA